MQMLKFVGIENIMINDLETKHYMEVCDLQMFLINLAAMTLTMLNTNIYIYIEYARSAWHLIEMYICFNIGEACILSISHNMSCDGSDLLTSRWCVANFVKRF